MSFKRLFYFHIILGALLTLPVLPRIYGVIIILYGIFKIVRSNNQNSEALFFASYLVGAEVLLRMTRSLFLYETGKYGVFLFLLIGAAVGVNRIKPNAAYAFYLLLLLLGIVFTQVPEGESLRKSVAFNLSGPFLLGACALYFYRRVINYQVLISALKYMLLPIVSMCIYLFFKTPTLSEVTFRGVANYEASGGFGPNQVSTILGLGVFLVGALIMTKKYISGNFYIDVILLIYLVFRGLLTFSRGGLVTGIIALLVFVFFYLMSKPDFFKNSLKIFGSAIIVGVIIWIYTVSATGGMLNNRYLGKTAFGEQKEDISSGRGELLAEQLNTFYDSPITGIGVGNGKYKRLQSVKHVTAASHNEIGRLIEEHGLIGVFSLLLLLISPFSIYFKSTPIQRAFVVSFFVLWFLTVNHSAMRIAFPGFIYALCLINIVNEEKE